MKSIKMMYTDLEAGMHQITENCSYLKDSFFEKYPTEEGEEKSKAD